MSMNTLQEIRETLFAHGDGDYKAFQCPLMPTVDPSRVIGVRTPILRRMARELRNTAGENALLGDLPHAYFEEDQLHAFLVESIPDFNAAVASVDAFLPFVNNWATCDQLSPKAFKGRFGELLPHIRRWMAHPHPYTCRFGLGMLLRYGLDEHFDPLFLEEASSPSITEREEYYVRMMVAWFFATALAKQYEAALPYIQGNRLPLWTRSKTVQKACESLRVTEEHKAELRKAARNR